jgi:hypothetical protein
LDCGTTVPPSDTALESGARAPAFQNLSASGLPIKPNQTQSKLIKVKNVDQSDASSYANGRRCGGKGAGGKKIGAEKSALCFCPHLFAFSGQREIAFAGGLDEVKVTLSNMT